MSAYVSRYSQPIDMTVNDLHVNAKIETLESRRSRQLIKIMFNLVQNNKYKKEGVRVTRTLDTFVFDTQIVHLSAYANSPYYLGVQFWNDLPNDIKIIRDKQSFNLRIQRH